MILKHDTVDGGRRRKAAGTRESSKGKPKERTINYKKTEWILSSARASAKNVGIELDISESIQLAG